MHQVRCLLLFTFTVTHCFASAVNLRTSANATCNEVIFDCTTNFTGSSAQFIWDFGDGSKVTQMVNRFQDTLKTNTFHTYLSGPKTFTVQLQIKHNNGTFDTSFVIILALPIAPLRVINGCINSPLRVETDSGFYRYQWFWDDGIKSEGISATRSFSNVRPCTIKLLITNTLGCISDTISESFLITQRPRANLQITGNCTGDFVHFYDNSGAAPPATIFHRAILVNKDTIAVDSLKVTKTFYATGTYTVHLRVATESNCADSISKTFDLVQPPKVTFTAPSTICQFANNSFTATEISNTSASANFVWHFGNDSAKGKTVNHQFSEAGAVAVSVYAVAANGCRGGAYTSNLSILPAPKTTIATTLQCLGVPIRFSAKIDSNAGTPIAYHWNIVDSITGQIIYNFQDPSPIALFTKAGTYSVQFVGTMVNGCNYAAVTQLHLQLPLLNAGADTTISLGASAKLHATGAIHYQWQPTNLILQPTEAITNTIPLQKNQMFTVVGKNDIGCIAMDTIMVTIDPSFILPNAFSPNGDGINDVWKLPIDLADEFTLLQVHDRYGRQVYASKRNSTSWDGRDQQGNRLPAGVYYYFIQWKRSKPIHGSVLLVR